MAVELLHSEITGPVIGAAMEVHKILGPGFLESVYDEAFAIELDLRNIHYERQHSIDIFYKGKLAKQFVCDFIIENVVVVELKALSQLGDVEKAQILNYLKATRLPVGLLLNFGTRSLEYKRFANTKSA
ncbi:MAG: GxxExxY protein [Planctomycetes bacterium]|nr:GxxExxY protein [Planctomycetota bacterium]MBL7187347.1 GxxExxY protein [Phycisphaerae bacterium]